MLYITTKENKTIAWEVGDSSAKSLSLIDDIKTIMACGIELEYIKSIFVSKERIEVYSIPMPQKATDVIWHGDIAKTIVSNIMY